MKIQWRIRETSGQLLEMVRNRPGLWVLSGCFGALNAAGQWMYAGDRLPRSPGEYAAFWLQALTGTALFFTAACLILICGPRLLRGGREKGRSMTDGRFGVAAFGVILAGWLPWLISYYPMSADYDVYRPILQYLGQMPKTNDFPWFYCTTVGAFYRLGIAIGDKNAGMFLYIALRAIVMAVIYANLAVKLKQRGIRRSILWAVILFYALVPVWGAYAKHGFKDTQAAALFCWYTTVTVEAVAKLRKKERRNGIWLQYGIASLAVSLYRGNCIFIVIPVTMLLMAAVLRTGPRPGRGQMCAMLLSGILVWGGYQGYIRAVEKVEPGRMASALTIPFQQTARTVRDHAVDLSETEREGIGSVLDTERVGQLYDPLISDPVKDTVHDLGRNLMRYVRVWAGMGLRYPGTYLEALIGQSYGYYAFTGDQAPHAGNWNCGMTIFDWVKDSRYDDAFTCDYVDQMQPVRRTLDEWARIWHRIPVLRLSDCKALYTWGVLLAGYVLMRRKRWIEMIPVCAILLTVLFCCGSPVNDCFRYFAPAAAAAPAVLLESV